MTKNKPKEDLYPIRILQTPTKHEITPIISKPRHVKPLRPKIPMLIPKPQTKPKTKFEYNNHQGMVELENHQFISEPRHVKPVISTVAQVVKPQGSVATSYPTQTQRKSNIAGQVVDSSGAPLPYVNISVKEIGTVSDDNGYFTIEADPSDTIRFDFMGYKTVEIPGYAMPHKVVMVEDVETIGEVDLGTVPKKKDNTVMYVLGGIFTIIGVSALISHLKTKKTKKTGLAKPGTKTVNV